MHPTAEAATKEARSRRPTVGRWCSAGQQSTQWRRSRLGRTVGRSPIRRAPTFAWLRRAQQGLREVGTNPHY
jgi:hypothetical protein